MPFIIVPASQVQKKAKQSTGQKRGRPLGTSSSQASALKSSSASLKRSTVTVAAYGGKLFEPVIAREKPIYVHFLDYIVRDDDAITRFSEDGFFAIKLFIEKIENKSRCYLAYFKNNIIPTPEHNLMRACKEAVDYELYEFLDKDEYVEAILKKDYVGRLSSQPEVNLIKLRLYSALGQAEQKIISILQEKTIAEKFLKCQQEYKKQDEAWQKELERMNRIEEEELKEDEDEELETIDGDADESSNSIEETREYSETEENQEVLPQTSEDKTADGIPSEESREGDGVEVKASSDNNVNPKPLVWGGGRKK